MSWQYSIVFLNQFIQATRDSGYKNFSSAIAELVDNSIEAEATRIYIDIQEIIRETKDLRISVVDNGLGMDRDMLRKSLQFGWSSRFNSRLAIGRYGMGLPNSSLSHARHVDVYSWQKPKEIHQSYLNLDEIISGKLTKIPTPKLVKNNIPSINGFRHGTAVVWSDCDRLLDSKLDRLIVRLHRDLGQIFRYFLWDGKILTINRKNVEPIDPLFLRKGRNLTGAKPYGPPLSYEIKVPSSLDGFQKGEVIVRFSELPLEEWHSLTNEQKRTYGITNKAGVSIVRSGREIDYGWFFMGKKRKENYDVWWRSEVHFKPILDELFGVTHTKQEIHPTETLLNILTPEMERIAYELNAKITKRFAKIKAKNIKSTSVKIAEQNDIRLNLPRQSILHHSLKSKKRHDKNDKDGKGLHYKIELKSIEGNDFFKTQLSGNKLSLILNNDHPFFSRLYSTSTDSKYGNKNYNQNVLELFMLALVRAMHSISEREKSVVDKFVTIWSNNIKAFLT